MVSPTSSLERCKEKEDPNERANCLIDNLTNILEKMDNKFDAFKNALDSFGNKFDAIFNRFDAIDNKFSTIDHRLDGMEAWVHGVDPIIKSNAARLDNMEKHLESIAEDTRAVKDKADKMFS